VVLLFKDGMLFRGQDTREDCHSLQKLHFRQILRIDYPNRFILFVDHDEIVNSVLIKDVQYFDRELSSLYCDRVTNHMPVDWIGNHTRIFLKRPDKIAVGEYSG
jgi:hypothetical protein